MTGTTTEPSPPAPPTPEEANGPAVPGARRRRTSRRGAQERPAFRAGAATRDEAAEDDETPDRRGREGEPDGDGAEPCIDHQRPDTFWGLTRFGYCSM